VKKRRLAFLHIEHVGGIRVLDDMEEWQQLCEQAPRERGSGKLLEFTPRIIELLNKKHTRLEQRRRAQQGPKTQPVDRVSSQAKTF